MVNREEVYQLVRVRGPLIPRDLTKHLKSDTIMVGAYLSELSAHNRVIVTHLKKGGSPFYYLPEQKEKLQHLREYLNEKDQRTFDLLFEKKVLVDEAVTPLTRVSLRNLKDFAIPVEAEVHGKNMLFWKWYLLSNEEVAHYLRARYMPQKEPEKKIEKTSVEEPNAKHVEVERKPVEKIEKREAVESSPAQSMTYVAPVIKNEIREEEPTKEEVLESPQRKVASALESIDSNRTTDTELSEPEKLVNKGLKKRVVRQASHETRQKTLKQKKIVDESDDLIERIHEDLQSDDFFCTVYDYFEKNKITIIEYNAVKKKSDLEFVIEVPTPIGSVLFYARAKSKKRSNENDLAMAYVIGESKKLPVVFLTTGDITKKAQSELDVTFKNLKIIHI